MREASENTKCLVKSQIKIGTPSKEPGAGGWYPKGKRRLYEGSGAGDGNSGGKRRPEGSGAGDGNPRGKRKAQEGGLGQDGNRAERGSPQERRKEF